jgi:hypothetical protein
LDVETFLQKFQIRTRLGNELEKAHAVIQFVDGTNIQEVMNAVPTDLARVIRREVRGRPRTDTEWQAYRTIRLASFCFLRELTEEEHRAIHGPFEPTPEELERLKYETALLRAYFDKRGST